MDGDCKPINGSSSFQLTSLLGNRRGNVAVMTALMLPILTLATFGGVSVTQALSKRRQLTDIAQTACSRAVKPTRMKILNDAERNTRGLTIFDQMAADAHLPVTSRSVTSGWLTAEVNATARIPLIENVALDDVAFDVAVSARCQGLPPYPAKGETILSSDFEDPGGKALPMPGSWGVYNATAFGWEGGSGPGVEIQDWKKSRLGPALPEGGASRYVVELDSHANSSMYRTLELHKGTYKISFWYWGRSTKGKETNEITAYLEGVRPVSPSQEILTAAATPAEGWIKKEYSITVPTYSLYRLTIAGEGTSDSYGGVFNNLKIDYVKRPGEA